MEEQQECDALRGFGRRCDEEKRQQRIARGRQRGGCRRISGRATHALQRR